jgi:hypothetical protein
MYPPQRQRDEAQRADWAHKAACATHDHVMQRRISCGQEDGLRPKPKITHESCGARRTASTLQRQRGEVQRGDWAVTKPPAQPNHVMQRRISWARSDGCAKPKITHESRGAGIVSMPQRQRDEVQRGDCASQWQPITTLCNAASHVARRTAAPEAQDRHESCGARRTGSTPQAPAGRSATQRSGFRRSRQR